MTYPDKLTVLVSGFEPFGGDTENTSWTAVKQLGSRFQAEDISLVTVLLPVSFRDGPQVLQATIEEVSPDLVLAVGEAKGRQAITPERWAKNLADATIPDNAGYQPKGQIIDSGPELMETRLDVAHIVDVLNQCGIPGQVSRDAGLFVCNTIFRTLLREFPGPAGFVHVPAVRGSQIPLSLIQIVDGLDIVVRTCAHSFANLRPTL